MAEIPDNIRQALTDYVQQVAQEITVQRAIVFGSYATGDWQPESDIDVAIFSEDFASMNRVEAITFLLNKALPYHLDIQPLAYDADDLAQARENPFIHEILRTGVKIA